MMNLNIQQFGLIFILVLTSCASGSQSHLQPQSYVIDWVYEGRIDLDYQNRQGESLLYNAILTGDHELALSLIEQGCDVTRQDINNRQAIHVVSQYGSLEVFEALIANGAQIDAQDMALIQPLHRAVIGNQVEIVRKIIELHNNHCEVMSVSQITPLHYAARDASFDIFQMLLKEGHDIAAVTEEKETVWHYLSRRSLSDTTDEVWKIGDLILEKNVNINMGDYEGVTPLMVAVGYQNVEMVKYLLNHGAEIPMKDSELSFYMILYAVMNDKDGSCIPMLNLLREHGVDLMPVCPQTGDTIADYLTNSSISIETIEYIQGE